MKKLISLFLVSLILCFSLGAVSVSAYDEDDWVLGENAEYVINNGYKFYPIYPSDSYDVYTYTFSTDLEFIDDETAEKFAESYVDVWNHQENYCAMVTLTDYSGMIQKNSSVLYVREDYIGDYQKLLAGEADQYLVENYYKSLEFKLSKEQMDDWLNGEKFDVPANSVYKFSHILLMAEDISAGVKADCGTVLWDKSADEFYLLRNVDHDKNKLYTKNDTLTIYKLEDEDVRERLTIYVNYYPEDELEWMNPGEPDYTVLYVLSGVFFGFIPLALLALSVVMLFVTKVKSYRRGFVLMGIGSLLILLAFVLMIILLI